MKIPKNVKLIIDKLLNNGYECCIVGGYVRDYLSNKAGSDIDLVTNAKPDEIIDIYFKGHKVDLVGKSYGIVIVDGIEIGTYRSDRNYSIGSQNCKVKYSNTLVEDLKRRDFTINALALDPINGSIFCIDSGIDDLKNRIVKFVGNPLKRIYEDPDRMIRGCRMIALIDGKFDSNTLNAIKDNAHLMVHIKPERIRLEILKTMKVKKASKFFEALYETGLLKYIFPEMVNCYKHPHGKYHSEDIFRHLMIVGDYISIRYPVVKLAGYLHDIGKPLSYDGVSFINHECIGKDIVLNNLNKLRFSNDEVNYISGLIELHMNSLNNATPKAYRKIANKLYNKGIDYKDFIRLKVADRAGNLSKENFNQKEITDRLNKFSKCFTVDSAFDIHDLKLSGGEIIKEFNLKPSKKIGNIQKGLLKYVIENGFEYNTKEKLLSVVKELM